jgi:hypothetical protein
MNYPRRLTPFRTAEIVLCHGSYACGRKVAHRGVRFPLELTANEGLGKQTVSKAPNWPAITLGVPGLRAALRGTECRQARFGLWHERSWLTTRFSRKASGHMSSRSPKGKPTSTISTVSRLFITVHTAG